MPETLLSETEFSNALHNMVRGYHGMTNSEAEVLRSFANVIAVAKGWNLGKLLRVIEMARVNVVRGIDLS